MTIKTTEDLDRLSDWLNQNLGRATEDPSNQDALQEVLNAIEELKSFYTLFPTPEKPDQETLAGFTTTAELLAEHGEVRVLGEIIDRLELLTADTLALADDMELEAAERLAVIAHQDELERLMRKTHQVLMKTENLSIAQTLADRV